MISKSETLAAILRVVMFGGCWWFGECSGLWGDDQFQHYVQRSDRMTMTSGDAKEVNAMAHIPTPWPRGVNDRRIVSDSAHMQRALERYRRGARPPDPMPDLTSDEPAFGFQLPPEQSAGQGAASGTGAGTATPAPYAGQ